jgi:hypothetical protein
MRELTKNELLIISGADVDRETIVIVGNLVGGLVGAATRLPNGSIYGAAIGGYVATKGYDAIANSPTITIPKVNFNPATHGTPSYISRPGMNSSIYGN